MAGPPNPAALPSAAGAKPWRLTSLRTRLLIALTLTILAFWIIMLGIREVVVTRDEGLLDEAVRDVANVILGSLPANFESVFGEPDSLAQSERIAEPGGTSEKNDLLIFQVWLNGHDVVHSSNAPRQPIKPDFVNGFADVRIGNRVWRSYDVSDPTGKVHVQVGKAQDQIAELLLRRLKYIVWVTLLLLVLPGIGIWWVTRWSFAPIDGLRKLMVERKPFDLTPLPAGSLPDEVQPLVRSFNRLLEQLDAAVRGERHFIADAAHELRTPLAVLAAQTDIALRADSIEEKNAALVRLGAGIARSARLSEQLLDIARLEATEKAPAHESVDLSKLVILSVRDFEAIAHGRQQTIALDAEPAAIIGDIDDLGILLRNLLDNALRYSSEGARVSVTCQPAHYDGVLGVRLSISDNGPGVPENERERIFDRFYRITGRSESGSGIGLSLVARIAASHHAQIDLGTGLDGRGFGIRVWFPRAG